MIQLELEEYRALVALAMAGASGDGKLQLDGYVKEIERRNQIVRYALQVRWQEVGRPLPAGTKFPDQWPPMQEGSVVRFDRPISKDDVRAYIASKATNPASILVTPDPAYRVGWTDLDTYFAR